MTPLLGATTSEHITPTKYEQNFKAKNNSQFLQEYVKRDTKTQKLQIKPE